MTRRELIREIIDVIDGARTETAELWQAARDATDKEPCCTREGNRTMADDSAFALLQSLTDLWRYARELDRMEPTARTNGAEPEATVRS